MKGLAALIPSWEPILDWWIIVDIQQAIEKNPIRYQYKKVFSLESKTEGWDVEKSRRIANGWQRDDKRKAEGQICRSAVLLPSFWHPFAVCYPFRCGLWKVTLPIKVYLVETLFLYLYRYWKGIWLFSWNRQICYKILASLAAILKLTME